MYREVMVDADFFCENECEVMDAGGLFSVFLMER